MRSSTSLYLTYISLMTNDVQILFMYLIDICITSWERDIYSEPLPTPKLYCLVIELWEYFIYFGYNSLIRSDIWFAIFSTNLWVDFHFLYGMLWTIKVLHFDEVQCTYLSFVAYAFGITSKNPLLNATSQILHLWLLLRVL